MNLQDHKKTLLNSVVIESMFKFPRVISSILYCFKEWGQQGGIVGGAVRDFTLHKAIRDYDVYIESTVYGYTYDVKEIRKQAKDFGCTIEDLSVSFDYTEAQILGVHCLTCEDGTKIDVIIGVDNIQTFVNKFTCDLSKIWYDVNKDLPVFTDEFRKCVETKVCNICDNRGSNEYTIEEYVHKIRAKYPEYTFVPEQNKLDYVPF